MISLEKSVCRRSLNPIEKLRVIGTVSLSCLAEHVGCPTMSRLLCRNRICAKSLLLGSFGLVPLLARVDGFDQDKAESKRDERAISLPAAARERK